MSESIIYEHNSGLLKLSAGAVATMKKYVQRRWIDCEAGGILLGRLIDECNDVVVDEVTTPMPGDWRSRFGFRRSQKSHQTVLNNRWLQSAGTCNYLGEWHTHPERHPRPSARDLESWEQQINRLPAERRELFFVIAGTQTISAWKVTGHPFQIYPLTLL